MTVRRLVPGDERHAAFLGEATRFLATAGCRLWAAFEGGEAVGWAYGHDLVHPDSRTTTLLYSLDVAEHARRRGHGAALVRAFVDDALGSGSAEVWVLTDSANGPANATYAAAGGVLDAGDTVMYVWT